MTLDKLAIVFRCFLLLKSVESSPVFCCTDVNLLFTLWCERAFTFAINITYCIKNKQSSPAHILKSNAKVTQK